MMDGGFVKRFWGGYISIENKNGYQVKRLTVKPGKRISLQKHLHRSEHWVVIGGVARVTLDDEEIVLRKGESTFVGVEVVHQMSNIGKMDLEIIEVQLGEYLGEDDIERFEDDFGREVSGDLEDVDEKFKPSVNVDERRFDEVDMASEEFCIGPEC